MNNIDDPNITLDKESHTYHLSTHPEINFESVTTIIDRYFEPFDEVLVATNLCNSNDKYMGMEPDQLISVWHDARDHGSKVHEEIELFLKDEIQPSELKAKTALEWLDKYCMKSDIEIFTEVIIYSVELQIAGTIDILAYDKTAGAYEIIDWKTSKKINTVSYRGKMGIHPITSNIMDCNFTHYAMQMSFYRFILEKNYDLMIRNQMIAHLTDEKCTGYITPYFHEQINALTAKIN